MLLRENNGELISEKGSRETCAHFCGCFAISQIDVSLRPTSGAVGSNVLLAESFSGFR